MAYKRDQKDDFHNLRRSKHFGFDKENPKVMLVTSYVAQSSDSFTFEVKPKSGAVEYVPTKVLQLAEELLVDVNHSSL